jgi:predicted membrane protein
VNAFAFMGGVRRNIVSPAFRRGNLTAIMGGVVLDMRQSQASGGETVVEVFAIWGGIEVKVPPDWQVVNEIAPIMGGVEDRSSHTLPIRHRLVLKGVVLMAGVEVKS